MEVGIRDLRDGLSRYLRRVRRGEAILVTEHGRPVARIIPVGIPADLERLIAEGRLTWSGRRFRAPTKVPRPKPGPLASDYISEDRR
jgi:prevent-host-death family protein